MTSSASTVDEYLAQLPDDRREAIKKVRATVKKNLPKGLEERMSYGMIGWVVPHSRYPAGYHANPKEPLPFANLASQKSHMALYLMTAYQLGPWLKEQFAARGKKLDMGKSCIRFKKLEDLPLDVIGEAVAQVTLDDYIALCEQSLPKSRKKG